MSKATSWRERRRRTVRASAWGVAMAIVALSGFVWSSPSVSEPQTQGSLEPQQIAAIRDFAVPVLRNDSNVAFEMSVGAVVPQNVQLQDMPRSLGEALPNHINDQYVVLGTRFVVVAKNTRRIIVIVPLG